MALLTLTTANKVNVGTSGPVTQISGVAAAAITAGAPVLFDANGKWVTASAAAGTTDSVFAIATRTVASGEALTAVRRGLMDGWSNLPAVGSPVFVSNTAATLADAAGTTSLIVGYVVPNFGVPLGTAADRLLLVECTGTGVGA